jgi:GntR family transcriptional regulator
VRDRVNRFDENAGPPFRQLAAVIRDAITDGDLVAHEAIPGEYEIADMAGLHRNTVRHAVDLLVDEGLLVKRSGQRTRVVAPPQVRVMSTARYAAALANIRAHGGVHDQSSAFTTDHGIEWDEHTVLAHYDEDMATPDEAQRLELGKFGDQRILRRDLVKQVRGETVQLQTSVLPLGLVSGTPVADPARQPWEGGTIAELYSIGLVVTRVREEARYRTPTPHERRELGIETTSGVLEVVRVFYVGEKPVEFSTAVVEANSYSLLYETEIK